MPERLIHLVGIRRRQFLVTIVKHSLDSHEDRFIVDRKLKNAYTIGDQIDISLDTRSGVKEFRIRSPWNTFRFACEWKQMPFAVFVERIDRSRFTSFFAQK